MPSFDTVSEVDLPEVTNAIDQAEALKNKGNGVAYVGDVVGTGSSRKSATNSVLWHMGDDIPCVPNKRQGGVVIGSELEPSKHARAVANLKEAGLDEIAEVRLGDALQTLRELPEPIDLVLLDGWKDLYLPVLDLVRPRLRKGAVVLADNIFTFRKSLRPYVEHMQSDANGFESTTLRISDGFEFSVYVE